MTAHFCPSYAAGLCGSSELKASQKRSILARGTYMPGIGAALHKPMFINALSRRLHLTSVGRWRDADREPYSTQPAAETGDLLDSNLGELVRRI